MCFSVVRWLILCVYQPIRSVSAFGDGFLEMPAVIMGSHTEIMTTFSTKHDSGIILAGFSRSEGRSRGQTQQQVSCASLSVIMGCHNGGHLLYETTHHWPSALHVSHSVSLFLLSHSWPWRSYLALWRSVWAWLRAGPCTKLWSNQETARSATDGSILSYCRGING